MMPLNRKTSLEPPLDGESKCLESQEKSHDKEVLRHRDSCSLNCTPKVKPGMQTAFRSTSHTPALKADHLLFVFPLLPPSRTFQRPTSAPGAGWSPCSLRHRWARSASCRPHSPLRHCPRQHCPSRTNLTEVRGTRGGLPSTPRGPNAAVPPGGSAESCPAEPRRPQGAGPALPGSRCRSNPHLPQLKHPFLRAGHEGRTPHPPASPGSPRPRARLRPAAPAPPPPPDRTGPDRDAPPGAAPQDRSEEEALLQEEPGGREEAPRVVDVQQLVPVGGVYHIDALQLPPQAQDVGDWSMVELQDVGLEVYPYSPGEAEDGTQEAVEITLRLPDNVIYFKVPMVARWEPAGQQWRADGINNITYKAEEKSITFRMGAFYTVALLQDAHLNLPCQAWELHPTGVDEGLFTVTAVFATIQIQIKDNQCMLSSVVVEEEKVLSHITGKWMSPFALREALKRAGVNIFPAEYSPEYVPVPRKAALAEVKAYEQMALLAAAFAHSKWNGEAGPERVVFKVSEHLTAGSAKDKVWSLYMLSGEKVQNLRLTETSEAFSEELEEESEFHSTLYHMLKDSASKEAMGKVERAGFLFIDSVYQLLLATRVLAYS
ncbi:dynein axonemal intermediate chain 7-like [Cinclus cinclus]|uniref:dynein axonemal intermediate chain 7-like n=1 Tax=Cinclus cinclus TaxID=127875 RepID=UPI002E0FF5DA